MPASFLLYFSVGLNHYSFFLPADSCPIPAAFSCFVGFKPSFFS